MTDSVTAWSVRAFHDELRREADADPWLIVQVTSGERFEAMHLPGAQWVDPRELMHGGPPAPGLLPELPRLQALVQRLGYEPGRRVIALDDEGGGWAGRFLWTLDCLGQRNWAFLDGGLIAWANAGLPLEQGSPVAAAPSAWTGTLDPRPLATRDEVLTACTTGSAQIWDARSLEEHLGQRSASARAGRIPGAKHLDWLELMDPARDYQLPEDLAARINGAGIDLGAPVIAHCQTHHRSSLAYLTGRLLGAEGIRAYAGSWSEWGNDPTLPLETGPRT
ncbi:MAG: rhodanese-like domain-containing protein [Pseudomonadota bacterium]